MSNRPPDTLPVSLRLNGRARTVEVEPWVTLLDLLRERLGLYGSKKGCDHGQCGACTVLVDGRRVNACLRLAAQLDGHDVVTVEGLAGPDRPWVPWTPTGKIVAGGVGWRNRRRG